MTISMQIALDSTFSRVHESRGGRCDFFQTTKSRQSHAPLRESANTRWSLESLISAHSPLRPVLSARTRGTGVPHNFVFVIRAIFRLDDRTEFGKEFCVAVSKPAVKDKPISKIADFCKWKIEKRINFCILVWPASGSEGFCAMPMELPKKLGIAGGSMFTFGIIFGFIAFPPILKSQIGAVSALFTPSIDPFGEKKIN